MLKLQNLFRTVSILLLVLSLSACKELEPVIDKAKPVIDEVKNVLRQQGSGDQKQITTQQMSAAMKQALTQGVEDSVYLLGSLEGFNLSSKYHINLPAKLDKPAELLRKLGQGDKVNDFENRLNRAAQQAVKQATPVFTDTIKSMSIQDVLGIMQGSDDAATKYFRARTESSLRTRFLPSITDATDKTGLTRAYKSLNNTINSISPESNRYTLDIDQYVLDHSMDALFHRIAIEEKLIREQPLKRTTELMKTVYGYFAK